MKLGLSLFFSNSISKLKGRNSLSRIFLGIFKAPFDNFLIIKMLCLAIGLNLFIILEDKALLSSNCCCRLAQRLKKQITIRIDEETVSYFKNMAEEKGIPYQSLINLYLRDCATEHRQLKTKWA